MLAKSTRIFEKSAFSTEPCGFPRNVPRRRSAVITLSGIEIANFFEDSPERRSTVGGNSLRGRSTATTHVQTRHNPAERTIASYAVWIWLARRAGLMAGERERDR